MKYVAFLRGINVGGKNKSKKNSLFSDEPRSKLTGHSPENFRPKRRNHEF